MISLERRSHERRGPLHTQHLPDLWSSWGRSSSPISQMRELSAERVGPGNPARDWMAEPLALKPALVLLSSARPGHPRHSLSLSSSLMGGPWRPVMGDCPQGRSAPAGCLTSRSHP